MVAAPSFLEFVLMQPMTVYVMDLLVVLLGIQILKFQFWPRLIV